jgi:hypothetical protein
VRGGAADRAGMEWLRHRLQHPQPVPLADALDRLQQRVMPADERNRPAIAVTGQRPDDIDRVELLQRDVQEYEIGIDELAGLQDLARVREVARLDLVVAQRERDDRTHGVIVLDNDAAQRSLTDVHLSCPVRKAAIVMPETIASIQSGWLRSAAQAGNLPRPHGGEAAPVDRANPLSREASKSSRFPAPEPRRREECPRSLPRRAPRKA